MIREQLGEISIVVGPGPVIWYNGVPALLAVQENNHDCIDKIVGNHVVDAHSVGRGDELVLVTKTVTLPEKVRRYQMQRANDSVCQIRESFLACWIMSSQVPWK
jgi:hypothetical protein